MFHVKLLAKLPASDTFDGRFVKNFILVCSISVFPDPSDCSTLTNSVHHAGIPVIHSGLKNMKVLKTTQSGFEGFLRDRFTTLQEAKDRCFCTSVYARWRYNVIQDINFDAAW